MEVDLPGVERVHRGKVRDVFAVDGKLLLVSSDRLSAYDHVLPNPIPHKGRVLTQLSAFWFNTLAAVSAHHMITTDVAHYPAALQPHAALLAGRSMLCHRARRVDVECVVRGYLAGSAWREYRRTGKVCGRALPAGMMQGSVLPAPLFTPTTKADQGHDQPIMAEALPALIGAPLARQLEEVSVALYQAAAQHAQRSGLVLADTKFEFGFVDDALVLIDEALTPDSSRYWDAAAYAPGREPDNFDKQGVRDFLDRSGWDKNSPPPMLPPAVVADTTRRYLTCLERLTQKEQP